MSSESTAIQQDGHTRPTDPVDAFLAYPFSTDAVYQVRTPTPARVGADDELVAHKQGLDSIVASGAFEGKSEEERAALMRSSQVFYFTRSAAVQALSHAAGTDGHTDLCLYSQRYGLLDHGRRCPRARTRPADRPRAVGRNR